MVVLDFKKGLLLKSFFVAAMSPCFVNAKTLIFQSSEAQAQDKTSVVESGPSGVVQSSASNTSSVNSELFFMVEQLKQEVMELRGLTEEQAFRIRQMENVAKDRYRDLDSRLQGLGQRLENVSVSAQPVVSQTPSTSAVNPLSIDGSGKVVSQTGGALGGAVVPVMSDSSESSGELVDNGDAQKLAYQQAYSLVKDKNFPEAIDALHQFVEQYPEGDLAGNAFYWLGEVYLVLPKLEQAKQAFSIVVQTFPGHRKLADAMYKLAVTHDRLQESAEAEQLLKKVQQEFPSSTAAKLASKYAISR